MNEIKQIKHQPLEQSRRIILIDALRGFALFGILMVNMPYMYEPMIKALLPYETAMSGFDNISAIFIRLFFEGKFFIIFSMLFGYGFYIFLNKSFDNENSPLPLFKKRLFILSLLGLFHIIFFWNGDVLLYYSVLGFVLILFRNVSEKKIFRWSLFFICTPIILMSLIVLFNYIGNQIPEVKTAMQSEIEKSNDSIVQMYERLKVIYSSGSISDIITARVNEYITLLSGSILFYCPIVFGMFLIGFWAAKMRLANEFKNKAEFFKKVFWWCFCTGIAANFIYLFTDQYINFNSPDFKTLLSYSMSIWGGVTLGLCYVSGIVLIHIQGKKNIFEKYFVPVGRMALTNYLIQSVICSLLFHSYGLGLYGKIETWQAIILTVFIFTIQAIYSRLWLHYFYFGPFEWLWKSLTYSQLQPMKKVNNNLSK